MTRELIDQARAQRREGNLDAAVTTLTQAIAATSDSAQLAELYGMLGGTRREQKDLVAAISAYDTGFRHESGSSSTYNALNRLVTRVLLEPASLSSPDALRRFGALDVVDVVASLAALEPTLRRDVDGPRRDDYWAAGDLALIATLNGSAAEARRALDHFDSLTPPAFAYEKYRETFAELAGLDTPRKAMLSEVRDRLARR
jgi:tetratricopeptide (TPR) repeat protein